jgi:hypothetical protein
VLAHHQLHPCIHDAASVQARSQCRLDMAPIKAQAKYTIRCSVHQSSHCAPFHLPSARPGRQSCSARRQPRIRLLPQGQRQTSGVKHNERREKKASHPHEILK